MNRLSWYKWTLLIASSSLFLHLLLTLSLLTFDALFVINFAFSITQSFSCVCSVLNLKLTLLICWRDRNVQTLFLNKNTTYYQPLTTSVIGEKGERTIVNFSDGKRFVFVVHNVFLWKRLISVSLFMNKCSSILKYSLSFCVVVLLFDTQKAVSSHLVTCYFCSLLLCAFFHVDQNHNLFLLFYVCWSLRAR